MWWQPVIDYPLKSFDNYRSQTLELLGSACKVKIRNTRECVLIAYPLQYLALK